MSARVRKVTLFLLSVVFVVVLAVYLLQNLDRYRELSSFSWLQFAALFALVIAATLGNGLTNYYLYRGLGTTTITVGESVGLAVIVTLTNLLPFSAGLIAKGVYLKHNHSLAYTSFLSASAALFVLFISNEGLIGIVSLGFIILKQRIAVPNLLLLGFAGMMLSLSLFWIPLERIPYPHRWQGYVQRLEEGWLILRHQRALLVRLMAINTITILIYAMRLWIVFRGLSQDVTLAQCLVFSAASILTQLVSITPGGLGLREGIVAGIAHLFGFDVGTSVIAVSIDRWFAMIIVFVLGIPYFRLAVKVLAQGKGLAQRAK